MGRFSVLAFVFGLLSISALTLAGHAQLSSQQQPAPQQPRFRGGVNFVTVDVYPTVGGRAVPDLRADEFEVLEDGAPQAIAAFEHVVARRDMTAPRVEPNTAGEANRMAADPRNRVFVLFLDTFHVTDPFVKPLTREPSTTRTDQNPAGMPETRVLEPLGIEKALFGFLDRMLAPSDLVAVATPETDVSQLTFSRRNEHIDDLLRSRWPRQGRWDDLDPEEFRWFLAYPDDCPCFRDVARDMVLRRREHLTFDALSRLAARLGQVREERKAIILISEGWPLYRPDTKLARALPDVCTPTCSPSTPGGKEVHVGLDGKLKEGPDPRSNPVYDRQASDSARLMLADIDDDRALKQLVGDANRANASFYTIDPRRLTVGPSMTTRTEAVRDLATGTDGAAMPNTNDLEGALTRIADDLSDYYLLGYNSTNANADGRFRRITVRVKRPSVTVRARRGYRAPTAAELVELARDSGPSDPEVASRKAALNLLEGARPDAVIRLNGACAWPDGRSGPDNAVLLVAGELDAAAARQRGWIEGGKAEATIADGDGRVLGSRTIPLSAAARTFLLEFTDLRLAPGPYYAKVKLTWSVLTAQDQVRIDVPSPGDWLGQALLFRRGPFTGPAFVPTGDLRLRRAERLRIDVPIATAVDGMSGRLLDRNGQRLAIPVDPVPRDQNGLRFASVEVALAPLAPAEYLVELAVRKGSEEQKRLIAFRIVP